MFPPDAPKPSWDVGDEYIYESLVVYAVTKNKRLLKIGKKMTLRDVMNSAKINPGGSGITDGLELRDGCMSLVVLPRGTVEKTWVEEYKSNRDRGQ